MIFIYVISYLIIDGIVGEVLLWTLKKVLGIETYSPEVHQAWLKIYCRMVRIIIPVAVGLELNAGPSQIQHDRVNKDSQRQAKEGDDNDGDGVVLGGGGKMMMRGPQCTHVVSRC